MELKKIGVIHSEFANRKETPRQGLLSPKESTIEVFEEYSAGLKSIEKLSHLIVLYWGDQANREVVESVPPWETEGKSYGVFSIRSPNRPNPLAFCVCKVVSVEGNKIKVTGLDAFDGSPLLDIKAYSAKSDCYPEASSHSRH